MPPNSMLLQPKLILSGKWPFCWRTYYVTLATLWILLVTDTLDVMRVVTVRAEEVKLAVMVSEPPCSTSAEHAKLSRTVDRAMADTRQSFGVQSLSFTSVLLDSCSEVEILKQLVTILDDDNAAADDTYGGLVGPGNTSVCEPVARLAAHARMPMTSWSCVDDMLAEKDVYTSFTRSVPSNADAARALTQILTRFKWKYVSIVFVTRQPYWEMASDVHLHLSRQDFDVTSFVPLADDVTVSDATRMFLKMSSDTRGENVYVVIIIIIIIITWFSCSRNSSTTQEIVDANC